MAKAKPKKVQVAETAEAPSKVKMKIFKHEPCDGHPDFGWFRYWYETEFDRATVTEWIEKKSAPGDDPGALRIWRQQAVGLPLRLS